MKLLLILCLLLTKILTSRFKKRENCTPSNEYSKGGICGLSPSLTRLDAECDDEKDRITGVKFFYLKGKFYLYFNRDITNVNNFGIERGILKSIKPEMTRVKLNIQNLKYISHSTLTLQNDENIEIQATIAYFYYVEGEKKFLISLIFNFVNGFERFRFTDYALRTRDNVNFDVTIPFYTSFNSYMTLEKAIYHIHQNDQDDFNNTQRDNLLKEYGAGFLYGDHSLENLNRIRCVSKKEIEKDIETFFEVNIG
jgi:hypothetical protein